MPVIIAICYITQGQQIEIAGAHLTTIRITVLFGFLRVLFKGEIRQINYHLIDKIFVLWVVTGSIIYILLWQSGEAFNYRMGLTYDAILSYFFFRSIFANLDDVKAALPILAVLIVPLAILLLYERFALRNVFSIFGAVQDFPVFVQDKIRAKGPFRHPIMAGSVASALLPLFIALWFKNRSIASLGIFASILMIFACNSSGPILSAIFALMAIAMWPMQRNMKYIRIGIFISVVILHLCMKAPVWHVITRLGNIMGGTGWHRARLIDKAIFYFNDWWLLGTKETSHWLPTKIGKFDAADITNQYIIEGVRGGLLTLIFFIVLIAVAFSIIGQNMKAMNNDEMRSRIVVWSLGASLFAHSVSFISVSYFDQTMILFYFSVAIIGSIAMHNKPLSNAQHQMKG